MRNDSILVMWHERHQLQAELFTFAIGVWTGMTRAVPGSTWRLTTGALRFLPSFSSATLTRSGSYPREVIVLVS